MASKKRSSVAKIILDIVLLIPNLVNLVSHITTLISKEARQAGQSIVTLTVLCVVFGMILASTWLCFLAMLFMYLTLLQWNSFLSILIVIGCNIVVLVMIGLWMAKAKNKLSFPATRQQCRNIAKWNEK